MVCHYWNCPKALRVVWNSWCFSASTLGNANRQKHKMKLLLTSRYQFAEVSFLYTFLRRFNECHCSSCAKMALSCLNLIKLAAQRRGQSSSVILVSLRGWEVCVHFGMCKEHRERVEQYMLKDKGSETQCQVSEGLETCCFHVVLMTVTVQDDVSCILISSCFLPNISYLCHFKLSALPVSCYLGLTPYIWWTSWCSAALTVLHWC